MIFYAKAFHLIGRFRKRSANSYYKRGPEQIWTEVCTTVLDGNGKALPISNLQASIDKLYQDYSSQGLRTLGIAMKTIPAGQKITAADESGMTLLGIPHV